MLPLVEVYTPRSSQTKPDKERTVIFNEPSAPPDPLVLLSCLPGGAHSNYSRVRKFAQCVRSDAEEIGQDLGSVLAQGASGMPKLGRRLR